MANTLIVDDTASAGLDYFKSSFSVPLYDSRLSDTYYESFFPVSGVKSVDSIRFSIPAKKGNKLLNIDRAIACVNIRCTNKDKTGLPPLDCGKKSIIIY